jgi:hypothetical protein
LVDGVVRNVVTFDFVESGIRTIYIVVNPDKLRPVASALSGVTHATEPPC